MPRKSVNEDDFDYDDDTDDIRRGPRKFKQTDTESEKKKKWDRESFYDRNNDYDERR